MRLRSEKNINKQMDKIRINTKLIKEFVDITDKINKNIEENKIEKRICERYRL